MTPTLLPLAQINPSHWPTYVLFLILVLVLFAIILCIFLAKYANLWLQAKMTSASITILELVGMSFRKVNPNIIVRSKIMAYQAGLSEKDGMTTRALEAHYLAGGNVPNVVRALIAANRADIPLSYKRAAAIDLAGRNVLEAVQTSVNPKVIPCPDPSSGRNSIDGVAKNGIQLKVKAKVTVRTNLDRLVGGATDETIIARVGEGIVNAIGSADTHEQVLERPDTISKRVLEKGLDAGTAYEILSIDIADVDVGDNIGANLQALQAEADTRVARAKAEERRAFAVAKEQEMVAQVQENRAKVVEAEAEIPKAIAEAFRAGPHRHPGLLQPAERPGRHRDAQRHRRHRQRAPRQQPAVARRDGGGRAPPRSIPGHGLVGAGSVRRRSRNPETDTRVAMPNWKVSLLPSKSAGLAPGVVSPLIEQSRTVSGENSRRIVPTRDSGKRSGSALSRGD